MPEISRFFGIKIRIFYGDHSPPHFHAEYAGESCVFDIRTLQILDGTLSPRAIGLVVEWANLRKGEIEKAWDRASNLQDPGKVEPLK